MTARLTAAGLLVAATALALAIGFWSRGISPQRTPVGPAPSPAWSTPVGSVFTTDPLMSAAEWNDLLEHIPAERTERTTAEPRPLDCITDPYSLGAAQVQGAEYLQPARQSWATNLLSSGRMNVYALWFTHASDAAAAVTGLRQDLVACRTRPDQSLHVAYFHIEDWLMQDYPRIEQQFTGSITRKFAKQARDDRVNGYALTVARSGKLVMVFESLNGWSDRPQNTMGLLMNRALEAMSPQVASSK